MVSEVGIINRALTKIGGEPIISRTDDSKRARTCNRHFDETRDVALAAHPWNFAIARASLAALTELPEWGFTAQYQLPPAALRLIEIDGVENYRVEGRRILTNAGAPLRVLYIARATDTAQYPPAFVDAFATLLAAEIAFDLTGSRTLADSLRTTFERSLPAARNADAQESVIQPHEFDGSWLEVRY